MNQVKRRIVLDSREVYYVVRRSARAKRVSLTIHPDGGVSVTLPKRLSLQGAERFIKQSKRWVLKKLQEHEESDALIIPTLPKKERGIYVEYAKLYVLRKLDEINQVYQFPYNSVRVKDQRSQWGSASHKKNLNFNYKLIFLPEELAEYVIAHELCHLKEMNHSPEFWKLLERSVRDPKLKDKELSRYHLVFVSVF